MCKKWSVLLKEGSLWTEIDLRTHNKDMTLHDLTNFISRYGCESTRTLMLYGVFNQDYLCTRIKSVSLNNGDTNGAKSQEKIRHIDPTFMTQVLAVKCANLQTISLEYLDLSELNIGMFLGLAKLNSLYIKWCHLTDHWFNIDSATSLPSSLKNFSLIKSGTRLSIEDMGHICRLMPDLTSLAISQATSTLTNECVDLLVEKLDLLEKLELVNTLIDDAAILRICATPRLQRNLTHLNISMSSSITNNCLPAIGDNLTRLKSLYLTSCFGVSNFNLLLNLTNLTYMNVNNTSIDKDQIRNVLVPMLPKCEIEYGHEKMLNKKLMWTINGSRNSVCSF